MNNTFYITLSKQTAQFRQMAVIANNIANVNTTGYKSERMLFDEYLVKSGPKQNKLSFTQDRATATNMEAGSLTTTDRQLDAAIQGNGFFVVQTPLGERYTRAGNFVVSADGTLTDPHGYPVLSIDKQAITFQPEDTDITIRENGLITVGGDDRGQLGVFDFANPQVLEKAGQSLFRSDVPGTPADEANYSVAQGMLETSNVSSVNELTNMISTNRSVTRTSELMKALDDLQRRAVKTITQVSA